MTFKRPKQGSSYQCKHKNYTEPSRPPTASSCDALKKTAVSDEDYIFSIPEIENQNNFLASQIISEAHPKVDSRTNIENPGFCGWSKVEKKIMSSDMSLPKCEALKSRKVQRSMRGRRISSARWSSPSAARARQLTAQSASRCQEESKLFIHSHTDRFIEDYRECKVKNLRESRNIVTPQHRSAGGVCSRLAESA
ncbi:hypothetical protein ECG_01006 [Echinococcus granulosus]|uniref:Uncharacterized protein n=1 Tax=Echinococcus granulosus TaxID=6210 RepID=U6IWI4_ECHGR|nr:hypothetical protein EGR_01548 [Echinococcus granulosus]EUB63466.1 hypothetical protein EGR_01548 [Echinococcus granulosus]KAH9285881.1 hypothetical protein ECG_01006 [Echinococcus granulosus]CDS16101.1 hypothetical protein EgrG_000851800 [Echinococcus granulosus]